MIKRQAIFGVSIAVVLLTAGCSASVGPQIPRGLPSSVRILPGTIVASSVDSTEWQVWVKSSNVVADYKAASALLLKSGFDTTYNNVYSTSGEGQFCNARFCVDVSAYNDPAHGKSVGYDVYRNSALGIPTS